MGRSSWARRLRDLVALHITDLGGDMNVSEAERAIIRRAAVIIVELERMEHDFALSEGAPGLAELETYQRMANSLRRLLESTGLRRRARDITPSLREYLTVRTEIGAETRTSEAPGRDSMPPESRVELTGESNSSGGG
jgi:hypothetical protein